VRDKNNALVIYSPVGYGIDPGSITGTVVYDDFTGDGSTVVFTLSASPSTKNATNVYIDGVYQSKDNYSTSGSTLTFSTAPPLNSAIEVVSQESSIIGGASSQQISYTQGGAGSVTRTVQSRLRDFVSVKDFGAIGDGVADDTAAIQAALATGLAIYFPEPTTYYKIETNLTMTSPVFAGLYRIFGGAGTVTIGDNTTQIFSEWWGDTTSRSTSFGTDNLSTASGVGAEQTVFGRSSLKSITTGYANGAFGIDVLPDNTSGAFNFGFGVKALWVNTTGSSNSAFGAYSMQANISGSANVSFGEDTNRYLSSGDGNTAVGIQSLYNNVTGTENVAVGRYAARNASNPPDLGPATGPSPSYITAVGAYALYQAEGTFNAAVGHQAGYSCSGNYNSFLGSQAGLNLTSGDYNTFIGYRSGQNASQAAVVTNSIAIGDLSYTTGDNAVAIGSAVSSPANIFTVCNSSHTFFRPGSDGNTANGGPSNRWSVVYSATGTINTSDLNEKEAIDDLSAAELAVASSIKGLIKKFKFKGSVQSKGSDARIHVGVIAQDVKAAFEAEGLNAGDYGIFCSDTWFDEAANEEKTRLGIRYEELLAFVIAAI